MADGGVYITVADPSADASAALLVWELRRLVPEVRLRGVGGVGMQGAGVKILADTTTNSAMGLGALLRAREMRLLVARVKEQVTADPPKLWICIDSWTLNVHFARLAKSLGIPVLYYVAPQTWASREGRVREMRKVIDRLACILPFEEKYFRERGVNATYVGHPLWDRLRTGAGVPRVEGAGPVVAILPGSRRGVTRANWPRLQRVMDRLRGEFPAIRFRLPLTRNAADVIRPDSLPSDVEARVDAVDDLVPGCDLALCVSGTAALHVAAHHVPLIVVYHGNPVLWHLIGRWVVRTRTYSLVNLMAGGAGEISQGATVAPEFIPWYGGTDAVADLAAHWLRDPAELERRRGALARVTGPLATSGASRRAAEIAAEMLAGAR
jgi:lipid-A-disaccharide synthase